MREFHSRAKSTTFVCERHPGSWSLHRPQAFQRPCPASPIPDTRRSAIGKFRPSFGSVSRIEKKCSRSFDQPYTCPRFWPIRLCVPSLALDWVFSKLLGCDLSKSFARCTTPPAGNLAIDVPEANVAALLPSLMFPCQVFEKEFLREKAQDPSNYHGPRKPSYIQNWLWQWYSKRFQEIVEGRHIRTTG